jgi:aspartate ammonia-lyase
MRSEKDFIGTVEIPEDALYGINSVRASLNFPDSSPFQIEWYRAVGTVKMACYLTYEKFAEAVRTKYPGADLPVPLINKDIITNLIIAAGEVEEGKHFDQFIVPAIQGGAGTSINMNVNEIITNRALILSGYRPGDYQNIHPIEQANVFQSTNDVIPTSLRVALLKLLQRLEASINDLRAAMENVEKVSRDHVRIAYTQMQEAVPSTYGRLFSTYCDALSRDWWRVSKCSERLKTVNLGGSAIGTGITVPRYFINEVVSTLQRISGLSITRGENLQDATCNLDALVETHATIKAHAVNLEKSVSDIRLLSSDIAGDKDIQIPQLQTGSSIMPGKVNPVIPEFVISAAHKVYSNDMLVGSLCGQGCLDLNAYIPVIGHALIESLKLLIACNETMKANLISGLKFNSEGVETKIRLSPSIATALLPYLGYDKSALIAREMKKEKISIVEANRKLNLIAEEKLLRIIDTQNLLKEGFNINDVLEDG